MKIEGFKRYMTIKALILLGAGLLLLLFVWPQESIAPESTAEEETQARLAALEALLATSSDAALSDTEKASTTPVKPLTNETVQRPQTQVEESPTNPVPTVPPPTASPESISPAGFSSSAMLTGHNGPRSAVGVAPLTYSASLAASAQSWADTLKGEACEFRHDYNTPYGENIYWQWSTGGDGDGLISSPSTAAGWWAAEEAYYDYDANECEAGEQCGHYTQMVWAETTAVGCGVSSCVSTDRQTDVWVCRYSPAGNDGSRPY